jgi:hypothetical protein
VIPSAFRPSLVVKDLRALDTPEPRIAAGLPSIVQTVHLDQLRRACDALERSAAQLAATGALPPEFLDGLKTRIANASANALARISKPSA